MQKARSFLYDEETKAIMGRDCKNWGLLLVFYVIYYICLAGFFVGMLSVHLYLIVPAVDNGPYLTGQQSLLRMTPSIGYIPRFYDEYYNVPVGSMVKLNTSDKVTDSDYFKAVDKYLKGMESNNTGLLTCSKNGDRKASGEIEGDEIKQSCKFDSSWLGECSDAKQSFESGKLCVYIKINKVYGWIPDLKNSSAVGLKCIGANKPSSDNIGEMKYFPEMDNKPIGLFSHAFFPFLNQKDYTQQLVAVQFPNLKKNVVAMVRCNLIGVDTLKDLEFEVMIADSSATSKR